MFIWPWEKIINPNRLCVVDDDEDVGDVFALPNHFSFFCGGEIVNDVYRQTHPH